MLQYIIEAISGLVTGLFLGATGIPATGIALFILDFFKVSDYKTILGAILFLNLFPISAGSVWEFYKAGKIDLSMGWILVISTMIGSYISSKLVVNDKHKLSNKNIKYITAYFSFFTGILFLGSAYYDKT